MRGTATASSDDEWAQLATTLLADKRSSKLYDRRAMLDGILEKVCTGKPWRAVSYRVGTYVTATRQFVTWRNNGTWDVIEKVIERSRASSKTAGQPGTASPAGGRPTYPDYVPLTDQEWRVIEAICPKPAANRKYAFREAVDLVLCRELTGAPWRGDAFLWATPQNAARNLQGKWRKDGTVDKLLTALAELRQPDS